MKKKKKSQAQDEAVVAKAVEQETKVEKAEQKADKAEQQKSVEKVADKAEPDAQTRISAIRQVLNSGSGLSAQDAQYLLNLLDRLDAAHMALKENVEKVRAHAIESNKQLVQAKDVLTMWLAMRGSADLEVFQATAALAQRSVQILNA